MSVICCISDCHLGFRHRLKDQRLKDFDSAFREAVDSAMAEKPDLLIFTGDMFHHPRPNPVSMHTLLRKILSAADSSEIVFCIGNHEIETHLGSSYVPLLEALHDKIHVLTTERPHLSFELDGRKVGVHGFQYLRTRKLAEEALEEVSKDLGESELNILCIHQAVEKYLEPHELSLKALRETASRYDLILSGHVHKHQSIAEVADLTAAFYVGSTEKVSFNEADNRNGFLIFRDLEFSRPQFKSVKSSPMRSIRQSLGKKTPAEINSAVEKLIEENSDARCLKITLSAEIDGDYFDVLSDWEAKHSGFTILDVSVEPTLRGQQANFEELAPEEDPFDAYFERIGLSDRSDLKELCKTLYEKYRD